MNRLHAAAKEIHVQAFYKVKHPTEGYWVAPELGLVFGTRGRPVGTIQTNGYVQAKVNRRPYLAHRLIYEATVGPIPEGWHIDHLNADRTDNRICNLEAVPAEENIRRARIHKAASPVITDEQRKLCVATAGLVTDAELADDWDVPIEAIRAARRAAKKH